MKMMNQRQSSLDAERRERLANAYEDGLQAMRAQGFEPSDFAKAMRDRVLTGELTVKEAIERIEDHYKKRRDANRSIPLS